MAFNKFGRNYIFTCQGSDGLPINVRPPFTLDFDVTRNVLTSANVAQFRIMNLNEKNQNLLRKNHFDYQDQRSLAMKAGYGDVMPLIFSGNLSQAFSVREGVDVITTIESYDGGYAFANGFLDVEFPAGISNKDVITDMVNRIPGVKPGVIGKIEETKSERGNAYSGNTMDILTDLTGGKLFIDNGVANVLGENECIKGDFDIIDASSGLIGTPVREQTVINFDVIFEPRLKIGQLIQLKSTTAKHLNGEYKVISIKHKGTISDVVAGTALTTIGLFFGTGRLSVVE